MITRAMQNEDNEFAVTRWSDALSSTGLERSWGGVRLGNRLVDSRTVEVAVPAEEAFRPIRRIGGATGWYYGNGLWRLRGFVDTLVGGVGLRRGRRDPDSVRVGDTLDFCALRQLKKPQASPVCRDEIAGTGLVGVQVEPHGKTSVIRQTAILIQRVWRAWHTGMDSIPSID